MSSSPKKTNMEKLHKFSTIFLKLGLTVIAVLLALSFYNFSRNGRYASTIAQSPKGESRAYATITITDTQTGKTLILSLPVDEELFAVDPEKEFKKLDEKPK
jgi:hypothetical protein